MNAPAARPMLGAPTPITGKSIKLETVGDIFRDPTTVKKLREVMPRHMNPEKMLRVLLQAIRTTPKLADCDPMSLLGALMTCGYVGLEPNTPLGHAYLIPFEKKGKDPKTGKWVVIRTDVQLIFGYRGLIDLARRGGELVSIHADVVYAGDTWSFEYGSNMHLRHIPMSDGEAEGKAKLWAYAHAKLKDGEAFEVLPYDRILKIRNSTQGYQAAQKAIEDAKRPGNEWKAKNAETSPWIAYEHEMAAKTMVRRLAKWLPMSLEYRNAMEIDGAGETGRIDFSKVAMLEPGQSFDPTMAITQGEDEPMGEVINQDQGQQAETVDRETGEVQQDKPKVKQITPEAVAAGVEQWNKEHPDRPMEVDPNDPLSQRFVEPPPAQQKPKAAAKPKPKPPADDDAGMLPSFGE